MVRTLVISSACRLSIRNEQLVIDNGQDPPATRHMPDVGYLIIEHPQVTYSHAVLMRAADCNTVVVICDERHMPAALMLPMQAHHLPGKRFGRQLAASDPLKKNLWKQVVQAKLTNQAAVLEALGRESTPLLTWSRHVQSGDSTGREAAGARHYFPQLFGEAWLRDPDGDPPNNLLNYGYTILRAAVARSLVGTGLLPLAGLFHHNQYNAYPLADDLMEPFRPFVDLLAWEIHQSEPEPSLRLEKEHKAALLSVLQADCRVGENTRPLQVAIDQASISLAQCYEGKARRLIFPALRPTARRK